MQPVQNNFYNGGIGNLWDHLTSHSTLKCLRKVLQLNKQAFWILVIALVAQKVEITKLIMELVISDVQPLRFVEGVGFLQLMSFIEPTKCSTLSKLIHQQHTLEKIKLKGLLESTLSTISLVTDICTSGATKVYITVSGHSISEDRKLYSVIVATSGFS